ncbi:N-acetylglucosamine-6-phosphate deacetylase [Hydrotalea sp.]|uniref:N-acetylglucosamine-6-phosphate deacetylase n=1 Tax=Hydrotalea sp. TaxID=2881279 RepID=UPI00262DA45D|nr:N-acetylglucosamine-6-phosphate deacetylase [Hydrotalea sp.]
MPNTAIIYANKIYTGKEWLQRHCIHVTDGFISCIEPFETVHNAIIYPVIAPALIDVQIYGAQEQLFAVYPNSKSLWALYHYCSKGGALHFLPTVATNTKEVMYACIDAVRAYWKEGGKGCLGLHLEGPWIHPAKKGAHIEALIHSPTQEEVTELIAYGQGVIKMITLAPEVCNSSIIQQILQAGIIVSAGHSNATFLQATNTFNHGITAVTHLYNAMSPLTHREPGLVGAALLHPTVMSSIIPDGYHVSFEAIQIAQKLMQERLFVITDAVTTTHSGPYQHYLNGDKYESNGILSGSALTMHKALKNLIQHVGLPAETAINMCSTYPAKMLGLQNQLGFLKEQHKASIIAMDEDYQLLNCFHEIGWIN